MGAIRPAPTAATTDLDWNRVIGANLTGAFLATKYSLPLLAESARIICLGAISERLRLPGFSSYAAAEAGLEAFVAAFAKEERSKSILLVRPGAVATPFWSELPIHLPRNAMQPSQLGRSILDAAETGQTGVLDIA